MTIDGNATTIHHNCTNGGSGLNTGSYSLGSIHLVSPLTKEMISTNNGGGGNLGGDGTIANINSKGIIKTIEEAGDRWLSSYAGEDYYAPRLRF